MGFRVNPDETLPHNYVMLLCQMPFEGTAKRQTLENVFVCGGGSNIPHLAQRLIKEVGLRGSLRDGIYIWE